MSLQEAAEKKMEKAIKTTNDDGLQFAVSEAEDGKIGISGDILRKFLEWIPLENLPNVTLASRRFWTHCDENLEKRKYVIRCLCLSKDSSGIDQLQAEKRATTVDGKSVDERKTVEFAEVAPPTNFLFASIEVTWNVGERAMNFLRLTRELFVGAGLLFKDTETAINVVALDKFLDVFDKCSEICLLPDFVDQTKISQEFFSKPAIRNCDGFEFFRGVDFDQNSILNWLHSPPTLYPNALLNNKQLLLSGYYWSKDGQHLSELLSRISKKFLEDNEKAKFIVRFYKDNFSEETFPTLRLENSRTGELLFSRIVEGIIDNNNYDLIRCLKEEEGTVAYEDSTEKENPVIFICE